MDRLILQTPEQARADAQVRELWRVAALCEGVAERADMVNAKIRRAAPEAAMIDHRQMEIALDRAESLSAFARAHARALRQAGNLHLVLSRPTPEVFA